MSTKSAKTTVEDSVDTDVEAPETQAEPEVLDGEFDRILPAEGEPLELSDGTKVFVRPLKMNGLFAAFRIITRGAAMSMGALSFSLVGESQEQFAQTLIALLINAFPEATFEFAEFLRVMVDPVPPANGWDEVNGPRQKDAENHLDALLQDDPEIDDALDIITTIIYREAADIQRLGKKIQGAAKMFGKVSPKTPQK